MLKVLIVDDNEIEREFLRFLLEEIQDIKIIGEAENGLEALELISTFDPDIIFLDIKMPEIDGIKVVKHIIANRLKTFIVFVTVERKFALEAFELDTVDYLLKPFDKSRLIKTIMRIKNRLASETKELQKKLNSNSKLFIRFEGEIFAIDVDDIIFIEKDISKYTTIHTVKGEYQSTKSIAELEQELSKFPNFFRGHKSYLINIDMVEKITPWGDSSYKVKFTNYSEDALISRRNAHKLNELFK